LILAKDKVTHGEMLLVITYENFVFQGLFPPGQGSTIGVDFMIKTIDVNKEPVKVYTFNFCM